MRVKVKYCKCSYGKRAKKRAEAGPFARIMFRGKPNDCDICKNKGIVERDHGV